MFGRLNDEWSHMVAYGLAYPMIVIILTAPLCAVLIGMGKREKREAERRRFVRTIFTVTLFYSSNVLGSKQSEYFKITGKVKKKLIFCFQRPASVTVIIL